MTPIEHETEAADPGRAASVTPNVIDIVEALQRTLITGSSPSNDDRADIAEIESILQRVDRELAVEEALTRQLMARHGM